MAGVASSLPPLSPLPAQSAATGTRRILVVGGGPSGTVALRNLISEESNAAEPFDVVLYERREEIGGVWHLDKDTLDLERNAGYTRQWPVPSQTHPRFPSPAYPSLVGNVFTRFVSFSDAPWKPLPQGELFPTLEQTFDYVNEVARPLRPHVKTKREVVEIWELPWIPGDGDDSLPHSGGWLVHSLDHSIQPARPLYEHFSAIDLCPSFTTHPSYPNVPGLGDALQRVPHKIHHAKWYRTADAFWKSKRVVVVGNGVSSNDIIANIVLQRKVHWGERPAIDEEPIVRAIRHEPIEMFPSLPDERILEKPFITRVDLREVPGQETPALDLTFANGERLEEVDHLIWGTGYQIGVYDWVHTLATAPSRSDVQKLQDAGLARTEAGWVLQDDRFATAPFDPDSLGLGHLWVDLTPPPRYPKASSDPSNDSARPTVASTSAEPVDVTYPERVPHLHNNVVNARNPTLAFGALIISVTPFVLADLTSRYTRCLWEGLIPLPARVEERRRSESDRFVTLEAAKVARQNELARGDAKDLVLLNAAPGTPTIKSTPVSLAASFHCPGPAEYGWQLQLRDQVLEAKPWLRNVPGLTDADWDEKRNDVRLSMYGEKRKWLERKENERRANLVLASVSNANGARKSSVKTTGAGPEVVDIGVAPLPV